MVQQAIPLEYIEDIGHRFMIAIRLSKLKDVDNIH